MSRPKFVQARKTSLIIGIASTETSEITLKELVDPYGNEVWMSDFGDVMYLTIAPGTENEEIISATGFTVNSDGSVTIDTGITRGLDGATPYTAVSGAANDHAPGTIVVASNNPQMYEAILDYIEEIALAGVGNATTTTAGVVEEATEEEIDADTAEGATGRRLAVNPSTLATSKYGTRLPSNGGKQLLDTVTGMIFDFAGPTLPTGFLACDGATYNNDDYTDLVSVLLGYYGYGDYNEFTADSSNDAGVLSNAIMDVDHGLENGAIVLLSSVDDDLPAGLTANTVYYVVNKTVNTFQLSLTSGGSAIDFTDNGSGTLYYHTQFKVPDLRGSVAIGKGQKTVTFEFGDADVNTTTDVITVEDNEFLYTGQAVALTTDGVLPTGLSAATYYVIYVSATAIKLATSRANADDGTAVSITAAAGGGTHTLTLTVNATSRALGRSGGEEKHTIQTEEMASHRHDAYDTDGSDTDSLRVDQTNNNQTYLSSTDPLEWMEVIGGDTPHNNMPPFVAVYKIIKT